MKISLFIAGDVVPKGIPAETFRKNGEQIFKDIKPHIKDSDFSIVNLEAPVITGSPTPIMKYGPCLCTAPSTVEVRKDAGFGIISLANNHFYDQGQQGVENTLSICKSLNMNTVGGGESLAESRKPLILNKDGKQIAIINACENEFSIANSYHGGSNPLDIINMQEDIAAVRKNVDYVISILHGGVEQYQYPTPRMKKWYRHFVDLGVDAVINHHQHCMNGYEVYKGKPIIYGLGNFYFPGGDKRPKSWQYGYAIRLNLANHICFDLIPYRQTSDSIMIRDNFSFKKEIELLNLPIADDYLLQQKFDEHLIDIENYLKSQLLPSFLKGKIFSKLSARGILGKLYYSHQIFNIKNKLTCESHYESLQRLFSILTEQ